MPKRHSSVHEPKTNNWLYAYPDGMPTAQIAAALNATDHPVTEVSARHWSEDWQMANAFMEAYGYASSYWFEQGKPVNGDALNDWLLIKTWKSGPWARNLRVIEGRFVGELVVIRHSLDASEDTLTFLMDIVEAHVYGSRKHNSQARILVALEGWNAPTLSGRVRTRRSSRRYSWVVNPLP